MDWADFDPQDIESKYLQETLDMLDSTNNLQGELTEFTREKFWGNRSREEVSSQVITKMLAEMDELIEAIEAHEGGHGSLKYLGGELADVAFMLYQLAQLYYFDLEEEVRKKLEINKARNWELQPDGTYQHIKEE